MALRQRSTWMTGLGMSVVLTFPLQFAAADDDSAPATAETTARSATALHLSKLATTGPKPAPIEPPKAEYVTAAIRHGVQFLLDDQRPDGSWGSPEKTKGLNIY